MLPSNFVSSTSELWTCTSSGSGKHKKGKIWQLENSKHFIKVVNLSALTEWQTRRWCSKNIKKNDYILKRKNWISQMVPTRLRELISEQNQLNADTRRGGKVPVYPWTRKNQLEKSNQINSATRKTWASYTSFRWAVQ